MNCYFIFEGKTEEIVYKKWLKILLPDLTEVHSYDSVQSDNYFAVSDLGLPHVFKMAANAILEINDYPKFDYLILVLDSDRSEVSERISEAEEYIQLELGLLKASEAALPNNCKLEFIVQKVCIETWFLGHSSFTPRYPSSIKLMEYSRYFNVYENDPELMGAEFVEREDDDKTLFGFTTIAGFHAAYFREVFRERITGQTYHKGRPKEVIDEHFLDGIQKRVSVNETHLKTFQNFLRLVNDLRNGL